MERLTIDEIIEHCDRKTGMYEKTCDVKYLETAFMGNGIKEYWEHKQVAEYLKKLKEYKDLEEQGLLLRLPCKEAYSKIGYEMYIICDRDIKKSEHLGLFVYPNGKMIIMGDKNMNYADIEVDEIGKTVFFTREGAESKLAEMEGAEE